MSTRPKTFVKNAKSKAKKEQKLETADDFQAAGVDFEDAAGKWRAGDAVKSMRFFQRAIEVYAQGLQKYPDSFDLAYNKARVELEIATHPVLVKHLELSVLAQLETTLRSHRFALSLDQSNPDVLFNTSQVLTSIAEEISKDNEANTSDALQLLEEALDLQAQCLQLQEAKYEEYQRLQQRQEDVDTSTEISSDQDDNSGGVTVNPSNQMQEDQWFTIEEPVTADTLIDSILAQLNTLTTLCGIVSSSPESTSSRTLSSVEELSSKLLTVKLPQLGNIDNNSVTTRSQEITLAKVNFISSLLEAGYRTGTIDLETYKREREAAFSTITTPTPALDQTSGSNAITIADADVSIANARSLISMNSALADSPDQIPTISSTRWTALSQAIAHLSKAANTSGLDTHDQAKTHLLRGDASLLQFTMSLHPASHPPAVANAAQLLKNAQVFYRNASKLALDGDEKAITGLRSAVASFLDGNDRTAVDAVVQVKGQQWVRVQLDDMSVEGLLPGDFTL